jgi:hypothetical protein
MTRSARSIWVAPAAAAALAGCVYYNAMWSAERYAKDARRLEARGQATEARTEWARAAVKAESVAVRHPRSRWADDALVLQIEGLAGSGSCAAAAVPLAKARETVRDLKLRERAGLAGAQCALEAGRPTAAEAALGEALASRDQQRRSRAEYLAGQAAAQRRDYTVAVEHFRRSREAAALPARVRALLEAGQAADAERVFDTLATARVREPERADLLVRLATLAGADAASAALDRHFARARLSFGEQARLLIDDGDRQLIAGNYDAAVARYRRAATVATPATSEAATARIREQRVAIVRSRSRDELAAVTAELSKLTTSGAQSLLDLVKQVTARAETPGARFRAAELARDSLGARALAGQLFLDAAADDSGSLYTPKALIAALALLPDRHDSIAAVLDTRYAASPYTRAYHGEPSVAYAAAEDSLARELGVDIAGASPIAGPSVAGPRTGPRGPALDDTPPPARAAPPPPAKPRPARSERQ